MNTYYIRVIVDPTGALSGIRNIARAIDGLEGKATRLGSIFRTLFAIGVATKVTVGLIKLGDAYSDVQAKIRQASAKTDLLTISMSKVFSAADRSRVSVEAFSKSVLTISGATATMNLGFDTSIRMSETLAKMMRLSGATTGEAASTMLQYGQAMRLGKLYKDEFRSVMTNSIELQRGLAKTLGTTTDQLMRFSKEGKITRQVMVDTLINSAADVDRRFAGMSMKVSDAITVIHNAAIKFAGELNLNAKIAPALLWVADHFEIIGKLAEVAGIMLSGYFVRKGLMLAVTWLIRLGVLMAANPFSVFMLALTGAIAALRVFGRDLQVSRDSVATWGDVFAVIGHDIASAFDKVESAVKKAISAIAGFFGEIVDEADISGKDIVVFFAIMVDGVVALMQFLKETVTTTFVDMVKAAGEQIIDLYNLAKNYADEILNGKKGAIGGHAGWKDVNWSKTLAGDESGWHISLKDQTFDKRDQALTNDLMLSKRSQEVYGMTPAQYAADQSRRKAILDSQMVDEQSRQATGTNGSDQARIVQLERMMALNSLPQKDVLSQGMEAEGRLQDMGAASFNPLRGATATAEDTMHKNLDELSANLFDKTGPIQKYVEQMFKDAEDHRRNAKPDATMGQGEFGGKTTPPQVDEKAKRKREQEIKQWEALQSSVSSVLKATIDLSEAQKTADMAVKEHLPNWQLANAVMQRKKEELRALLDPYGELVRLSEEDIRNTQHLNGDYDITARMTKEINDLRKAGIDITRADLGVTDQMIASLERRAYLEQALSDDQKRKVEMLGRSNYLSASEQRARALGQAKMSAATPADFESAAQAIEAQRFMPTFETATSRYQDDLKRIAQLGQEWTSEGMAQNDVFAMQKRLLEDLNNQYGVLGDKQLSIAEGLKDGWNKTFDDFRTKAEDVATFIADAFGSVRDAITTIVMSGADSWEKLKTTAKDAFKDMVTNILSELARLATQRMFFEIMKFLGGSIGGNPNVVAAGSQVLSWGNTPDPLGHHDSGGVFKVSGPPGRDNVFAPMMLTSGELLTITPRTEAGAPVEAPRQQGGGGPTYVVVVRNEREAALHTMQSPAGRRIQTQNIRYNEAYLRTLQSKS